MELDLRLTVQNNGRSPHLPRGSHLAKSLDCSYCCTACRITVPQPALGALHGCDHKGEQMGGGGGGGGGGGVFSNAPMSDYHVD